jgi:hypothetical protein
MNTGSYSVFATVYGMKMYYFFVECKQSKRMGSSVLARGYAEAQKKPENPSLIPSPVMSNKSPPFIIS